MLLNISSLKNLNKQTSKTVCLLYKQIINGINKTKFYVIVQLLF